MADLEALDAVVALLELCAEARDLVLCGLDVGGARHLVWRCFFVKKVCWAVPVCTPVGHDARSGCSAHCNKCLWGNARDARGEGGMGSCVEWNEGSFSLFDKLKPPWT